MPSADVVVAGVGLAGLATALELTDRGARVLVVAAGHAATHWTAGTLDVAAPPGAATPRDGVARLAAIESHPYAHLADEVEPAVRRLLQLLDAAGLPYSGDLDAPLAMAPTGIGGTRPVAITPAAQVAAVAPWAPDEHLVVCGIAGFKDLWPSAVAASLARRDVWIRNEGDETGPASVGAVAAVLPGVESRHNLTALHLARSFDDPTWRRSALDAIARAVERVRPVPTRIALPAVLGLRSHADVLAAAQERLPAPVFEVPLVPPSVPGLRLHDALRAALVAAGVRIQVGEAISRVDVAGGTVRLVATPAAVREFTVRTGALVIATGGLAGGGIVGTPDGRLREALLDLPVSAPSRETWFAADPFDPAGHPLEAAGIVTDRDLRPLDGSGRAVVDGVRIVGSSLAGQRWLRERCGDGVALASARRAAASLSGERIAGFAAPPAASDTTSSAVRAAAPPIAAAHGSGS